MSQSDKRGAFHLPISNFYSDSAYTIFYTSGRLGLDTLLVSVDHLLDHLTAYGACFS